PRQDRCSRAKIEHLRKTLCTACQLCLWSNRRNRVAINDHIGMLQGAVCYAIVHSASLNHYWFHRCSRFSWLFCCYSVSLSAVNALRYSADACRQDHRPTECTKPCLCSRSTHQTAEGRAGPSQSVFRAGPLDSSKRRHHRRKSPAP